jgi:integrase
MANRIALTDAGVDRKKRPLTGREEVKDVEPGLSIRLTPNGQKSWSVVYRLADPDGKRTVKKRRTIGHFPGMGVAEARVVARQYAELARQGIDPVKHEEREREAAQRQADEAKTETFGFVAQKWVEAMLAGERAGGRTRAVTEKTALGRQRFLQRYVRPTLGDFRMADITKARVRQLRDHIKAEVGHQGTQEDGVLDVLRLVFKFAASEGYYEGDNPTLGLGARKEKRVQKGSALSDPDLKALWRAAGEHGSFGRIIRLLMLTGQRRGEIAGLTWGEIDWERRFAIIPADRVKNRAGAHEVPLSDTAIALLREAEADALAELPAQEREAGLPGDGLVFPSEKTGDLINGWSKLKPMLDRTIQAERAGLSERELRAIAASGRLRPETQALKDEALAKIEAQPAIEWRIHDLRHTFITRTRDGEENADGEVVWSAPIDVLQATVNHEITVGVTKAYDHGDIQRRYRLRKRELLDWWARKLMVIVGEAEPQDNVVPMRAHMG